MMEQNENRQAGPEVTDEMIEVAREAMEKWIDLSEIDSPYIGLAISDAISAVCGFLDARAETRGSQK